MNKVPTLYEWAGDMKTFQALFSSFYAKVLKDEVLAEVCNNMSPDHISHVTHFVAKVFGGDKLYTSQDVGRHSRMIGQHIGKRLTETQRQRWVHLLLQTADEVGLKSGPEFRSAFVGYIEWGTRLAVINSHWQRIPLIQRSRCRTGYGEKPGD
ncbi:MAG TPA: group II truncated hemoglobin [Flavitalea sp.]|nr:group II truncated hemoglobin [Flavitalea sp.]